MDLVYPKKSHRKTIVAPSECTALAEFIGIEFGDGGINNEWQIVITLNSVPLLSSVAQIFIKNGIQPHIAQNGTRIFLYKEDSVVQYLKIFGSSNPRIYQKFSQWRDG